MMRRVWLEVRGGRVTEAVTAGAVASAAAAAAPSQATTAASSAALPEPAGRGCCCWSSCSRLGAGSSVWAERSAKEAPSSPAMACRGAGRAGCRLIGLQGGRGQRRGAVSRLKAPSVLTAPLAARALPPQPFPGCRGARARPERLPRALTEWEWSAKVSHADLWG